MRLIPFKTRKQREVEARSSWEAGARPPTWLELTGGTTVSGEPVTLWSSVGLPAVGRAIRLLSTNIAQLPLNVYRGYGRDKTLADQTWQFRLLRELPGMGDFTPFDLLSDIVACLEAAGNAYVQKVKAAGEVVALIVIDPGRVRVTRENGEKVFYVKDSATSGEETRYTQATILHIRGFTLNGSDTGLSPIGLHRQKLGAVLAQDRFHGRFFGQGTQTNVGIEIPDEWDQEQARDFRDSWVMAHAGGENAHLPAVIYGGAKFAQLGMSLADSQFVEGAKLNLLEVAHIYDIPPKFLVADSDLTEQDFLALYSLALAPRLRRIEQALFIDADLFPQRIIYPEFDVEHFYRLDAKTKAEVAHMQIQDGSLLVNEYRAELGRPPVPGGDEPQQTPVGGAPNPNTNPMDMPPAPQPADAAS